MNQDEVYLSLPDSQNWASLDDVGRKQIVGIAINTLLAEYDRCNEEPDEWEANDISTALGALLHEWNTLALNCVARALEPPNRRAMAWPREPHTPTIDALRMRLEKISWYRGFNG